jgi:hypothetical protein
VGAWVHPLPVLQIDLAIGKTSAAAEHADVGETGNGVRYLHTGISSVLDLLNANAEHLHARE